MTSLYPCNHEPYVERKKDLVIYRCGICGAKIWTHPARHPIDWRFAGLVVAMLLSVIGLLSWLIWIWLRAA